MKPRNFIEEEEARRKKNKGDRFVNTIVKTASLYLIAQSENSGYDTYDSAVVVARSTEEARHIHPGYEDWNSEDLGYLTWASKPENVSVIKIGQSVSEDFVGFIVISSFNAG